MISDKFNRHDNGSYTEITDPSLNINVTDEGESKEIIVHETLLENNSKDVSIMYVPIEIGTYIGKGLVTDLAFKTKLSSQKYKKASYAIGDVSEKDLPDIIKKFEKIGKLPYEKKRPKHEPTPSYFHIVKSTC